MARVHHITSVDHFAQYFDQQDKLIVVEYSATWCGPCKKIAPYIDQLAKENPSIIFMHLDIDKLENSGVWGVEAIDSVPTFKFYRNGSKLVEFSGASKATLAKEIAYHKITPK